MPRVLQTIHCTALVRRGARRLGTTVQSHRLLFHELGWSTKKCRAGGPAWTERKESGGVGSSHTTPCGAAVPARPPTRSPHIREPRCVAQWAAGHIKRSTRVVVPAGAARAPPLRLQTTHS